MKASVYVKIKISPSSGYILINEIILENEICNEYNYVKERRKEFGFSGKIETIEGFKLQYILTEVEYDGRKRKITENDVLSSLEKQGLAKKVGESMFGGFYLPTEKLKEILRNQYNQRKELVNKGEYELVQ